MSQSSWKQTNSRDKTFTLGLNTSITVKDITTSGKLEVNTIEASEFIGTGVVDSSASLGGVTSASGEIATANAIKNYINYNIDVSAFFVNDIGVLRPKQDVPIGGFDGNALAFENDISADANLYVGGDVSLNQKLYVVGDISADANLYVGGDVSLNQKLYVVGDISADANLYVGGDVSADANLYVGGDVSINQNLYVSASLTTNINLKKWESATILSEFSQRIRDGAGHKQRYVAGFGEGGLTAFGGGSAFALNNDGSKIVRGVVSDYSVCKVSVSEYIDGNWYDNSGSQLNPIGNDISGVDGELVGWSCDINSAGGRVIVGAPGFNSTAGTSTEYD
jgi:cytoskeletal protein CcmA (bactofilin family)